MPLAVKLLAPSSKVFISSSSALADTYFADHLQLLNETTEGTLTEWRIRQALQARDWLAVQRWIERLPQAKKDQTVWRYWAIRSMEADASTTADLRLEEMTASLAKERDFYGFLASEKLNKEYSLNHNPVIIDEARINSIKLQPAMQRARELFFHRDGLDANREWLQASNAFTYQDWLAAAIIASQWQWHDKAIASLGRAKYWDDVEIRFPLAYSEIIDSAAEKTDIASQNPELVEQLKKDMLIWHESVKSSYEGAEYGTKSLQRLGKKWSSPLTSKPKAKKAKSKKSKEKNTKKEKV